MNYTKPPLTLEQQADLLLARGMDGNRDVILQRLSAVGYTRLGGYWRPFRQNDGAFRAGTTFDKVWEIYAFDRRLRLLVLDAIERLEVTVRNLLAYHHAHINGPFAYAEDPASLPEKTRTEWSAFVTRVQEEATRSHEPFVEEFRVKYLNSGLPVWLATEIMSFGSVLTFYRGSDREIRNRVAQVFAVPEKVFSSWLLAVNATRNICAHHGRLWNRELGLKPLIPRPFKYPQWHDPVPVSNHRVFGILTLCRHCLSQIAPQSRWPERLMSLLNEHPSIPLTSMGFPVNWLDCPIWKELGYAG